MRFNLRRHALIAVASLSLSPLLLSEIPSTFASVSNSTSNWGREPTWIIEDATVQDV
jgi:hypothetical protein